MIIVRSGCRGPNLRKLLRKKSFRHGYRCHRSLKGGAYPTHRRDSAIAYRLQRCAVPVSLCRSGRTRIIGPLSLFYRSAAPILRADCRGAGRRIEGMLPPGFSVSRVAGLQLGPKPLTGGPFMVSIPPPHPKKTPHPRRRRACCARLDKSRYHCRRRAVLAPNSLSWAASLRCCLLGECCSHDRPRGVRADG
jgi:hypothetical protein